MKLEVKNNWEILSYFFNGAEIEKKLGGLVLLQNGDKVEYESRINHATYSDHGKETTVGQYVLIALIPYNDQIVEVRLEKLDIKEFLNDEYGKLLTKRGEDAKKSKEALAQKEAEEKEEREHEQYLKLKKKFG